MKLPFEIRNTALLIKKEAETNTSFGKRPEDQTAKERLENGVICLNKPAGPTSHQVSDYVQRVLEIQKSGHGGTLDPMVTGVLPVALGKGTRILQALLDAGKEYVGVLHLHEEVQESLIHKTAKEFVRTITQLPPLRSAVKRQKRERKIYYLEVLEIKGKNILFKVGCQAGTYIRTLCVDWSKAMKVNGHMAQLLRTKAASFNDKEWYSLHDLKDAYEEYKLGNEEELKKIILPAEAIVRHLPKIYVSDTTVDTLCHGADLSVPGIVSLEKSITKGKRIAILSLKGELIALGNVLEDAETLYKQERGKAVLTDKVFMEPNTYPKFIKK